MRDAAIDATKTEAENATARDAFDELDRMTARIRELADRVRSARAGGEALVKERHSPKPIVSPPQSFVSRLLSIHRRPKPWRDDRAE